MKVAANHLIFCHSNYYFWDVNHVGGTASYMLGMSPKIASQADGGNTPANIKSLSIGWMMAFLFAVSFLGLFSIVPLRKVHKQ